MSKMIVFCGSPNSGKTVTALKVAQDIYFSAKSPVIFLSPDLNVPCMAYLFPHGKDSELFSVGIAMDKTDIYKEDVIRQFVNTKSAKDFSYLGFSFGENKYTYPTPTEDKISELIVAMKECAAYIVVDCTNSPNDLISTIAKRDADVTFQLHTPDIKCIAYYASSVNEFLSIEGKKQKILNMSEGDLYLPIQETVEYFGGMDFVLPYSRPLKQQMITGTLSERLVDFKYSRVISEITRTVL